MSYPRPPVAYLPPPSAPANARSLLFSAPYAKIPVGSDIPDVAIRAAIITAVALVALAFPDFARDFFIFLRCSRFSNSLPTIFTS